MNKSRIALAAAAAIALSSMALTRPADAATPTELLAAYAARSARAPSAEQGKAFFAMPHGRDWSCATCHGVSPATEGRHAVTGRSIQPLAPGANPTRFMDRDKADKWFGRNCGDVVGRACTDAEKADVLAWLITLKP